MDKKSCKITIPEGYEIDEANSSFEEIVFKPKQIELPKTWEEFCTKFPCKNTEYFIETWSCIGIKGDVIRHPDSDRNLLASEEDTKALRALCQLIRLRDCYNTGWKPDWTDDAEVKYVIEIVNNNPRIWNYTMTSHVLSFKTAGLAEIFCKNFENLINIAKPLL